MSAAAVTQSASAASAALGSTKSRSAGVAAKSSTQMRGKDAQGINSYYKTKIEELEIVINDKTQNLRRLEAQRNQLNTKGETSRLDLLCLDEELTVDMS
jgi:hypothetical protein